MLASRPCVTQRARYACGAAALLAVAGVAACSSETPRVTGAPDASSDGFVHVKDAARDSSGDAGHDATIPETGADVSLPTVALIRLANWSPDAPGIDFCVAPRGTASWIGPVLATTLGATGALGNLSVIDAGIPFDAGTMRDAGGDAADARVGPPDAQVDAGDGGADAPGGGDSAVAPDGGGGAAGVFFPRVSPYVSLTPGEYDVRVVTAGATDCSAPVAPDTDDLPALRAGLTETFAVVGDTMVQGSDPSLTLVAFSDDTSVAPTHLALRFINALPSVTQVSFVSGTVTTTTVKPYLSAALFGGAGVETDAGVIDSNDYLLTLPIANAVWSLVGSRGTVTLAEAYGANIPAGRLATVVAVGGESGPLQQDVGILLCTDVPPIISGETASCELFEATKGVCPRCP
jgi:hypothetical protein